MDSRQAVLGNRGPVYDGSPGAWRLAPGIAGQQSNRLRIFAGKNTWEGSVGFNDGRVVFLSDPECDQVPLTYRLPGNGQFVEFGSNSFLKIYGDVFYTSGGVAITPYDD